MYSPNFTDPRNLRRIKQALGFSLGVLSTTKPHQWSTRYIDKHFGVQSNPLSKWLRSVLLVTTNDHYNKDTGKCKEYLLNEVGASYLKAVIKNQTSASFPEWAKNNESLTQLTLTPSVLLFSNDPKFDKQVVNNWCQREFGTELADLNFEYEDKSNRLWHPLQNVRSQYRKELFAEHGLNHQYDIECCAPTLIHQHSQMQNDPMDLYLFALRSYLKDRSEIRKQIAKEVELDEATIKVFINALFSGAKWGYGEDFALSTMIGHDKAKFDFLTQHEFISELRSDIKHCWSYIKPSMTKTYITDKNGKQRKLAHTSRDKWSVYFRLERQVLNAVKLYLEQTNNKHFLEHDGWTSEKPINELELRKFIYSKTGFKVVIEHNQILNEIDKRAKLEELLED